MNIHHYYRKFLEKSRAFFSSVRIPGKWINITLFAVFIMVIILIVISRSLGVGPGKSRHIDISISPQFENLFGKDLANALINEFEKQRPDLRIKKSNEGASLLFFDDSEFGRLRSNSELLSLGPYIDTKTKEEELAAEQDVSNTQWALPLLSFMDILFYNIDILQSVNFDRPPKTHAEFLAAAKAVAHTGEGQNAVYSFALDLADPQGPRRNLYPWVWAAGGEIYTLRDSASASNNAPVLSRTAVDTIAFFAQFHREGLLSPGQKTSAQRLEEFAKGKIAMITGSTRDIAFLQRGANNINFGITAIPGTAQGKNRLGLFRIYVGISADCPLPDQAWTFISFITGKSQILAEALSAIPGSLPAVFPGEYIVKNPLYSKAWDIFEASEIVEYRVDYPSEEEIERLVRDKIREWGGLGNRE